MALNKGQIYEQNIQQIFRRRNLLPNNLEGNDAGFIHRGDTYFVEVKNKDAPDFGQKGLIWDRITKIWNWRKQDVVTQLYDNFGLRNHIDRNFTPRRYMIEPKEKISLDDKVFYQKNFETSGIPLQNLQILYEFYARKKCFYIQVEGKGLFHLKADAADLGVPKFNIPLTLRLRAKTHHSNPVYKYSFFAVIQANTNNLIPSKFDLEGKVGQFPAITK